MFIKYAPLSAGSPQVALRVAPRAAAAGALGRDRPPKRHQRRCQRSNQEGVRGPVGWHIPSLISGKLHVQDLCTNIRSWLLGVP